MSKTSSLPISVRVCVFRDVKSPGLVQLRRAGVHKGRRWGGVLKESLSAESHQGEDWPSREEVFYESCFNKKAGIATGEQGRKICTRPLKS